MKSSHDFSMTYTFSVITKNTLSAGLKQPCANVQYATIFYTFHYLHGSSYISSFVLSSFRRPLAVAQERYRQFHTLFNNNEKNTIGVVGGAVSLYVPATGRTVTQQQCKVNTKHEREVYGFGRLRVGPFGLFAPSVYVNTSTLVSYVLKCAQCYKTSPQNTPQHKQGHEARARGENNITTLDACRQLGPSSA